MNKNYKESCVKLNKFVAVTYGTLSAIVAVMLPSELSSASSIELILALEIPQDEGTERGPEALVVQ